MRDTEGGIGVRMTDCGGIHGERAGIEIDEEETAMKKRDDIMPRGQ